MREAFVGFDSAWTGKKTGGLASASLKPDEEPQVDLVHKPLPNFETAAKRISDLISSHDYVLVAIDQPTIVPNLSNSRPVDRVAASLMSSLRSGAQPANRGKKTMFGNDAPIWKFLEEIGARENPVAAQTESKGLFLIEVFPALALPALRPYFYYRRNAARYNPDKKEMFRIRDWKLVAQTVEHHSERQGLLPLASWARCLAGNNAPAKEDQDQLDAAICLLVALQWRRASADMTSCREIALLGDGGTGYMVTPVSSHTATILSQAAKKRGVPFSHPDDPRGHWVRDADRRWLNESRPHLP